MLTDLSLAELAEIDNRKLAILFATHLQRVALDIEDRKLEKKPRLINIKLAFIPDVSSDQHNTYLDGCKMQVQVTSQFPEFRTQIYDFAVKDGTLSYSKTTPTDHTRPGLPGFDDEGLVIDSISQAPMEVERTDG